MNSHGQSLDLVRSEIHDLEKKIYQLRIVEKWFLEHSENNPTPESNDISPDERPYAHMTVREATYEVLAEHPGLAMTTREIATEVLQGGYHTGCASMTGFRNSVFGTLSNYTEKIVKVKRGLWTLKDPIIESDIPIKEITYTSNPE